MFVTDINCIWLHVGLRCTDITLTLVMRANGYVVIVNHVIHVHLGLTYIRLKFVYKYM